MSFIHTPESSLVFRKYENEREDARHGAYGGLINDKVYGFIDGEICMMKEYVVDSCWENAERCTPDNLFLNSRSDPKRSLREGMPLDATDGNKSAHARLVHFPLTLLLF